MIVSSGFGHDPGASVDGLLGRVAEWQTRTVQVRVSVRTWGFNSPLAHHPQIPVEQGFLSLDLRTVASKASPRHHGGSWRPFMASVVTRRHKSGDITYK